MLILSAIENKIKYEELDEFQKVEMTKSSNLLIMVKHELFNLLIETKDINLILWNKRLISLVEKMQKTYIKIK